MQFEKASFHMPGHKGRLLENGSTIDLTELPGLDDLTQPTGVLQKLEQRAAAVWQAARSIISVNGASAGIVSVISSLAPGKRRLLVPRNTHRSAVSALVLTGLEPIWYDPVWNSGWGLWTGVSVSYIKKLFQNLDCADIAGMLVVSPTYAGVVSDVESLADLCHENGLPLIVDEAHGAHFLNSMYPASALTQGADLVVHSMHKTLPALTQTGVIHVSAQALPCVDAELIKRHLNLIQSSSPSYPLLRSIETAIEYLESDEGKERLRHVAELRWDAQNTLALRPRFEFLGGKFAVDPLHLMLSVANASPEEVYDYCAERGVFAEAILGRGVLFLLGIGSQEEDVQHLLQALEALDKEPVNAVFQEPPSFHYPVEQVISPREAFLLPSQVVPTREAVGKIAAECLAPCPPGIPICVPGQKVHPEVMNLANVKEIRVVSGPVG